ncbi:hypothetical protein TWF730_004471 [Orbilia blumenaviensis]|uniref:Uncharacterized protein n=1 Tax=Orbilia blumenaviensis TaxID=1796055 RepID=A0AAV9U011_9PEZI
MRRGRGSGRRGGGPTGELTIIGFQYPGPPGGPGALGTGTGPGGPAAVPSNTAAVPSNTTIVPSNTTATTDTGTQTDAPAAETPDPIPATPIDIPGATGSASPTSHSAMPVALPTAALPPPPPQHHPTHETVPVASTTTHPMTPLITFPTAPPVDLSSFPPPINHPITPPMDLPPVLQLSQPLASHLPRPQFPIPAPTHFLPFHGQGPDPIPITSPLLLASSINTRLQSSKAHHARRPKPSPETPPSPEPRIPGPPMMPYCGEVFLNEEEDHRRLHKENEEGRDRLLMGMGRPLIRPLLSGKHDAAVAAQMPSIQPRMRRIGVGRLNRPTPPQEEVDPQSAAIVAAAGVAVKNGGHRGVRVRGGGGRGDKGMRGNEGDKSGNAPVVPGPLPHAQEPGGMPNRPLGDQAGLRSSSDGNRQNQGRSPSPEPMLAALERERAKREGAEKGGYKATDPAKRARATQGGGGGGGGGSDSSWSETASTISSAASRWHISQPRSSNYHAAVNPPLPDAIYWSPKGIEKFLRTFVAEDNDVKMPPEGAEKPLGWAITKINPALVEWFERFEVYLAGNWVLRHTWGGCWVGMDKKEGKWYKVPMEGHKGPGATSTGGRWRGHECLGTEGTNREVIERRIRFWGQLFEELRKKELKEKKDIEKEQEEARKKKKEMAERRLASMRAKAEALRRRGIGVETGDEDDWEYKVDAPHDRKAKEEAERKEREAAAEQKRKEDEEAEKKKEKEREEAAEAVAAEIKSSQAPTEEFTEVAPEEATEEVTEVTAEEATEEPTEVTTEEAAEGGSDGSGGESTAEEATDVSGENLTTTEHGAEVTSEDSSSSTTTTAATETATTVSTSSQTTTTERARTRGGWMEPTEASRRRARSSNGSGSGCPRDRPATEFEQEGPQGPG